MSYAKNWLCLPGYLILIFLLVNCKQGRDEFKPLSSSLIGKSVFPQYCTPEEQKEIDKTPSKKNTYIAFSSETALSPGDIIEISVENDPRISGIYTLDASGRINLPYISSISLSGLSEDQASKIIKGKLEVENIYRRDMFTLSLHILHLSSARVFVSGAVFYPGQVIINDREINKIFKPKEQTIGDHSYGRALSTALKAAGGVKPNANIKDITLIRNGIRYSFNMSGAIIGIPFEDVPLISGDQVLIPKRHCHDSRIAKPTAITAPGIRIYISNVTANAPSVIPDMMRLPYGTRFSHALASASCIGGSAFINATRFAILIRHTDDGGYAVLKRSIEAIMKKPGKISSNPLIVNPLLRPDDVIACYDSKITNIREIFSFISESILPFATLNALTK